LEYKIMNFQKRVELKVTVLAPEYLYRLNLSIFLPP
jgi:hypothetical protein